MFEALAEMTIPWGEVDLFQVDERIAPTGHPDRNLGDLAAHLLGRVIIPWRNVHPMPVNAEDPDTAADCYAGELQDVCGGVLDLVHLGLGDDGHTASWPPGHTEVDTWTGDVGVTAPFNGRARLTLTPAAVNRARLVLWLVSGAAKAPSVTALLVADPVVPSIPANRVTVERQILFGDDAALDRLPGGYRP